MGRVLYVNRDAVNQRQQKTSGRYFYAASRVVPVSYTHLDVYKRQEENKEKYGRIDWESLAGEVRGGGWTILEGKGSTCLLYTSIPEGSKNIDGAKEFLEFISAPENAQVFNDADGSMSCITGVKNTISEFEDAYQMIDRGDVYEMMSNMWPVNYNTTLMDYISAMLLNEDLEGYLKDVNMITPDFYK